MDLDNAKQYAFRLLGYRQRSKAEIAEKLRGKKVSEDMIAAVIKTLERTGCLDDERFARDFVESKLKTAPSGRKYFKAELLKKKINEETTEKVLEDSLTPEREYEAAYSAGRKFFARSPRLDSAVRLKRTYGFLVRRGFDQGIAGEILDRLKEES